MRLSYVIVTHNRVDALLKTLAHLHNPNVTPLEVDEWEAFVIDNGSTDGTCDAVAKQYPGVKIIRRDGNEGAGARSHAFPIARGEYLILLDDDSYPTGDCVANSLEYMDATPSCGALVGRVVLPDGSHEACAFPNVMLSGAVCLRKSVVDRVGGFRPEFFRKAGEYDYSFRFWQAGASVERFEDVVYAHDKVMTGRSSALAHRMDLRNNLIIVERFLPRALRAEYRRDFVQRYSALARHAGQIGAARRARLEAAAWRIREAMSGRQTLSCAALEASLNLKQQRDAVERWADEQNIRRVVIADFSKNLFATYTACERAGVEVLAIADDHPAYSHMAYRGAPILRVDDALALQPDGVILSNVNPAQVGPKAAQLERKFAGSVLTLWTGRTFAEWKDEQMMRALAA
jgi:hypothetical protein